MIRLWINAIGLRLRRGWGWRRGAAVAAAGVLGGAVRGGFSRGGLIVAGLAGAGAGLVGAVVHRAAHAGVRRCLGAGSLLCCAGSGVRVLIPIVLRFLLSLLLLLLLSIQQTLSATADSSALEFVHHWPL